MAEIKRCHGHRAGNGFLISIDKSLNQGWLKGKVHMRFAFTMVQTPEVGPDEISGLLRDY